MNTGDDELDDVDIEVANNMIDSVNRGNPPTGSRWRLPMAELGNDVAYVIMRLLRVVLGFAFGAGCIFGMLVELASVYGFCFSFGSASQLADMSPRTLFWAHYWWLTGILGILVPAALYALKVAIGIPYRYQSGKPGLNIRHCEWCRGMTADTLMCGKCERLRLVGVASKVVWLFSLAVTMLWVLHDVLGTMLFFASL